ncbi:hypothetical protein CEUSTIGMA_g11599.t1 [Chlamydomonas eustigma]|uniref:Rhodanese domain-containing protein n=1 Tax=Chlamydomonas eustigma TaxID=1157962 RepID=A0A250XMD2_9CHLO|nr:hypothetical protein CEUSTIGMA_g11599.t1 [Chlamydomonas eustigma]|eukprot:GAX84176.1 hypothetical protein CEUSTIGMA_g11599.t1 [Chlamydomonas eustigma]
MNSIKANHFSSTLSRTKVSFQQRLTPRHVSKAVETSEQSVLTSDFVSTPVIDDIPPIFIEPSSALSIRTVEHSSPPETTYSLTAPSISSYPSGKSLSLKAETESDGFPGMDSFSDVGSQAAEAISKASEKASSAAGELVGSMNSLLSSLGKQVKDMASEEAGVKVEDVSGSATSLITTNLREEVVGSSSEPAEAAARELNSSITSLISGFVDQLGDVTEETESAAYEVSGSVTSLISGLVDQLGDVTGDIGSATDELTGNVTSFISGLGDQLEVVTGSTGASVIELASDVSSMLSGIEDQAMSNVSSELLSSSFEEASGALIGTVSESASALTSTVSESASSLKEASETLTSTMTEATSSAAEAMSEVTDSLTLSMSAATQDVLEKVEEQAAAVQDLLQEVVAEFGDVREGAASAVAETVEELQLTANGSLQQILGVLPPDVRETVLAVVAVVTAAVSSVSDTATHYPRESAVAAAVVAVPVIMGVIKAGKPEGYSGDIEPALVRALLQEDIEALAELDPSLYRRLQKNAVGKNLDYVLIDIREDEEREGKGRPELKLGARFKVAALPLSTADTLISPDLARRGRNMEVLKLDIAAAIIAGLKEVKSQLANVVIMDNTGSSKAREVARALRREGVFQAYVMKGGYQQWVSQDLPTSEGATYETNASLLIKDEVEFLTEKAQATWEEVKKPEVGLPILGGTVVGSIALINYHTTLQVIGLWVLASSVYNGTAFSFASNSVSTIAKLVGGGGSSKSTEPNSKEQALSLSTAGVGASRESNVAQSPSSPTTMQSSSQEQQFDDSEDMEDGPSDTPDEASEVVNTNESVHEQEQPDKLKEECSAQVLVESEAKSSMPSEEGHEVTSENNQAGSVHGKEHAAEEESSLGQDAARVVTENSASWISDTSQTATPSRALS